MSTFEYRPAATVNTVVMAHKVAAPMARPPSAWPLAPRLVVCPLSNSSHRPASSSPRSSRVEVSRPQMAPRTIKVMEALNTVKPATVCSWGAGPNNALPALFDPNAAARCSRSVRVL